MRDQSFDRRGQDEVHSPLGGRGGAAAIELVVVRNIPDPAGVIIEVQRVRRAPDYAQTRNIEAHGDVLEREVIHGGAGLLYEAFLWPTDPLETWTPLLMMINFAGLGTQVVPIGLDQFHQLIDGQIPAGSCQDAPVA